MREGLRRRLRPGGALHANTTPFGKIQPSKRTSATGTAAERPLVRAVNDTAGGARVTDAGPSRMSGLI